MNQFRLFRREKSIKELQMQFGISKKDAETEYKKRQQYIYNKRIENMQKRDGVSKADAIKRYAGLKRKGRNDILDSYTY